MALRGEGVRTCVEDVLLLVSTLSAISGGITVASGDDGKLHVQLLLLDAGQRHVLAVGYGASEGMGLVGEQPRLYEVVSGEWG